MNMNKIPDKIYIHRTIHLGLLSGSEIDITGEDEQYIRKDDLLEWAKEQQRKWKECINTSKKFSELEKSWITYSGAKIQTEELIEKLNSM